MADGQGTTKSRPHDPRRLLADVRQLMEQSQDLRQAARFQIERARSIVRDARQLRLPRTDMPPRVLRGEEARDPA